MKPRVTEILKATGMIDTQWFTDEACIRGTYVHQACQYLDEGGLNYETLDPQLLPYVNAYRKFMDNYFGDTQTTFAYIEDRLISPEGTYSGKPDRVFVAEKNVLYDIKSGVKMAWHRLQLTAYVHCLEDEYSYDRKTVYLKSTGDCDLVTYPKSEYSTDLACWLSLVNVYNWKRRFSNVRKL